MSFCEAEKLEAVTAKVEIDFKGILPRIGRPFAWKIEITAQANSERITRKAGPDAYQHAFGCSKIHVDVVLTVAYEHGHCRRKIIVSARANLCCQCFIERGGFSPKLMRSSDTVFP